MTDKTERDVLVAKLREANEHLIGAFEHHRAITEAIEALAAPAEGDGAVKCPECDGNGDYCLAGRSAHPDNWRKCEACNGSGKITRPAATAVVPETFGTDEAARRGMSLEQARGWNKAVAAMIAARLADAPAAIKGDGAVVADEMVEGVIERVGRENSIDGMDGDAWDRLLVRAALATGGAKGMRDAYEGAREDLLDWKGRAQRAERTLRGLGYTGIDASEAPQPAAPAAPKGGVVVSIEAAEAMGAVGGPASEPERQAFEAWMRGHCWSLCATWNGTEYRSDAEQGGSYSPDAARTRMLWAAWRDRAALVSRQKAAPAAPKGGVEVTDDMVDRACRVYGAYMQDVHGSGNEADDFGMRAALTAALATGERP